MANLSELIREFDLTSTSYRETEYLFDEDPLVLSCSLKDYYIRTKILPSLESSEIKENITPAIISHAENIRKYYTKKFFWLGLQNDRSVSGFRSRTNYLLENRVRKVKDQDKGIYFKLPWFYDEDMIYDEFKKTLNVARDTISNLSVQDRTKPFTKRLEFLKTSFAWQRKNKIERFWFKDDNNFLYGIEITVDNPLLEMFKETINEQSTHLFQTKIVEDRIDNLYYYKMHSFKIIKEKNA